MHARPGPPLFDWLPMTTRKDPAETFLSRNLGAIAGALLGLAIVLYIRRYGGINHDAPLYMGQALEQRWPAIFGNDLFFAHGSQGSYTLFPWLLGLSFDWIDPPSAFLWGSLAAILLFAAAGWYCLSGLLPKGQRYWAWLGVLCLPSMYGRTIIFSYHEPFLTPRPIAESLCLLAIGLLARGRYALAIASLACAGVFHPLQAIAAALVIWPWLVMQDHRWLHAAWGAIPILLLAFAGIAPFDGLLRQVDAAWLAELRQFTGQLFVTEWPIADQTLVGFDAMVLAYSWRVLQGRFGAWCMAALAGVAVGMAGSLVLVDWLHLVLPAGLQLWRVHWLAHWLAMAAIGVLVFRDVSAKDISGALCLGMGSLLALSGSGWLWLPFTVLYVARSRLLGHVKPQLWTLLGALFALGLLVLLADYIANEWLEFRIAHYRLELYAFDRRILAHPLVALGLPLLCVCIWTRLASRGRLLLVIGLLCPVIAFGAFRWDTRSPITLAFERNASRTDLFGTTLPAGSLVYWDDDTLVGSWLILQRANYFNPRQLSGLVFNRGTAMDARVRLDRVELLYRESMYCKDRSIPYEERQHCRVDDRSLRLACSAGPTIRPDYLVLPYRQAMPALGSWAIMDPATGEPALTYWLYGCREIMRMLGRPRAPLPPKAPQRDGHATGGPP